MTAVVRDWRTLESGFLPLPHPSWRNTGWLAQNPWFAAEVVPYLRRRTAEILNRDSPSS
jgi:uracil-DNA glycosylase